MIRAEHVQARGGQVDADFGAGLDDFGAFGLNRQRLITHFDVGKGH